MVVVEEVTGNNTKGIAITPHCYCTGVQRLLHEYVPHLLPQSIKDEVFWAQTSDITADVSPALIIKDGGAHQIAYFLSASECQG